METDDDFRCVEFNLQLVKTRADSSLDPQISEQLAPRHVVHHKVQFVFSLESIMHLNYEWRADSLQNFPFTHDVFNLIVLNNEFLSQDLHSEVLVYVFLDEIHFPKSSLTQEFQNFEIGGRNFLG